MELKERKRRTWVDPLMRKRITQRFISGLSLEFVGVSCVCRCFVYHRHFTLHQDLARWCTYMIVASPVRGIMQSLCVSHGEGLTTSAAQSGKVIMEFLHRSEMSVKAFTEVLFDKLV